MRTVSIRELHLRTGRWVRYAAHEEPLVITDRGRCVAELRSFKKSTIGRPLPDREARILRRSRIPVDSVVYQEEMRSRTPAIV